MTHCGAGARYLAELQASKPGAIWLKHRLAHERKGVFRKASLSRRRSPYLQGNPAGLRHCRRAGACQCLDQNLAQVRVGLRVECWQQRLPDIHFRNRSIRRKNLATVSYLRARGYSSGSRLALSETSLSERAGGVLPKMLHSVSIPGFGMMSDTSIIFAAHRMPFSMSAPHHGAPHRCAYFPQFACAYRTARLP